jgi:hypothetical protein
VAKPRAFQWCPVETEKLFASPWFWAMKDFQRGWYLCLLLRAWEKTPQLQLPNDDDELQILAGVTDSRMWQAHKKLVLDRFLVSTDGKTLSNPKLRDVYKRQIEGYERRRRAGEKGGQAKAANAKEKRKAKGWRNSSNATAMPEHCYVDASNSNSMVGSVVVQNSVDVESVRARAPTKGFVHAGSKSGAANRANETKSNILDGLRSYVDARDKRNGTERHGKTNP